MFNALRQNSPIYILDKGENPSLKIGQIISVTPPTPLYGQFSNMTVDITALVDGQQIVFQKLPSAGNIATSNGLVVAESREIMLSEVEGYMKNSQQILDNIPYHEKVVKTCEEMMKVLNPQFAKAKDQEEKLNALETKVGGMEGTLGDIKDMLVKALNK